MNHEFLEPLNLDNFPSKQAAMIRDLASLMSDIAPDRLEQHRALIPQLPDSIGDYEHLGDPARYSLLAYGVLGLEALYKLAVEDSLEAGHGAGRVLLDAALQKCDEARARVYLAHRYMPREAFLAMVDTVYHSCRSAEMVAEAKRYLSEVITFYASDQAKRRELIHIVDTLLMMSGRLSPEGDLVWDLFTRATLRSASDKNWDVFISYASEDKEDVARPLAVALKAEGVRVWFDEFSLKLGDSLRGSIDHGLANSRFGVIILSRNFFAKHWTTQELNGLASLELEGRKVIIPIWHAVELEVIRRVSPILADRKAARSEEGPGKLAAQILEVLRENR